VIKENEEKMNSTEVFHRKVAESAKEKLIFLSGERTERKRLTLSGD